MMIPTILAEDCPHFLRAVGVLPMAAVFPALGLEWTRTRLQDRLRGRSLGWAGNGLAAMVLIIAMLLAVTIFFIGLYIANLLRGEMRPEPEL